MGSMDSGFPGCVIIGKTTHIAVFVIPALDQVQDDGPGIQCFFEALRYWMPDQVRHDGHKLSPFFELRHSLFRRNDRKW